MSLYVVELFKGALSNQSLVADFRLMTSFNIFNASLHSTFSFFSSSSNAKALFLASSSDIFFPNKMPILPQVDAGHIYAFSIRLIGGWPSNELIFVWLYTK